MGIDRATITVAVYEEEGKEMKRNEVIDYQEVLRQKMIRELQDQLRPAQGVLWGVILALWIWLAAIFWYLLS